LLFKEVSVEAKLVAQGEALWLSEAAELSAEQVAELLAAEVVILDVDEALSEWGSQLDSFFQKVEKTVTRWHEASKTTTIMIRFAKTKPKSEPDEPEQVVPALP
jgi:hypothetical protein